MFPISNIDQFYANLVRHVLNTGVKKTDRTGVGTIGIFGGSVMFDLSEYFPIVSLKQTNWKSSFKEMVWFLSGECSNVAGLNKLNSKLWDNWADENGNLGPVYGVQWREWQSPAKWFAGEWIPGEQIDQLARLLDGLKNNPYSRRLIVEGWNVGELPDMALPPCHKSFQCVVTPPETPDDRPTLNLSMELRSSDVMLGLPFNIAQYAFLTHLLAKSADMWVGKLQVTFRDVHIYSNHVDGAREMLSRKILPGNAPILDLESFEYNLLDRSEWLNCDIDAIALHNYNPNPKIDFEVAV